MTIKLTGLWRLLCPLLNLRALEIREQMLDPNHLDGVEILDRLGDLYSGQDRFAEAAPLLRPALTVSEVAAEIDPIARLGRMNALAHVYGTTAVPGSQSSSFSKIRNISLSKCSTAES